MPGSKVICLKFPDNKIMMNIAYGVERKPLYQLILEVMEKNIVVKIFGKYTWTAEHVRRFEEFLIDLRKFLLLYKTK